MHATRTPGTLDRRVMSSVEPHLLHRLDQVESAAHDHRVAVARLAAAQDATERRQADHEVTLAQERHSAALTELALDFRRAGLAHLSPHQL